MTDIEKIAFYLALREIDDIVSTHNFVPTRNFVFRRLQDFCLREIKANNNDEVKEILKELFWQLNSQNNEK
jgi:hypothetical protein